LMIKSANYIPENVNFAVASPVVLNILKNKNIKYSSSGFFSSNYSNVELAKIGKDATLQLYCRNTKLAYNKLKKQKKYSHLLLDLK